jgi:hypothetical protein
MIDLIEYIQTHSTRGACQCGRCYDAMENPKSHQPTGHTADVVFFKVALSRDVDSHAKDLQELLDKNKNSYCNPLDGNEHSYIELGGWIGDQGLALQLIGLGHLLGLWVLMTPETILGIPSEDRLALDLAGAGFVSMRYELHNLPYTL